MIGFRPHQESMLLQEGTGTGRSSGTDSGGTTTLSNYRRQVQTNPQKLAILAGLGVDAFDTAVPDKAIAQALYFSGQQDDADLRYLGSLSTDNGGLSSADIKAAQNNASSPYGSGVTEEMINDAYARVNNGTATFADKVLLDKVAGDKLLYGGGANGGTRLSSDDPRYWQLQYDQLNAQLLNSGLDAESARRQALATLIANRNNTASDTANVSANVAKTAAEFAANPRDAVAELMYRNQVGGSVPFGDMTNDNFGEYGKALAAKAASIFQPVSQDINQLRTYRDSIAPVDFLGPETRSQLGLQPTAAQALTGAGASQIPASAPTAPGMTQAQAQAFADFDAANLRKYAGVGEFAPKSAAKGGSFNFDGMFAGRDKPGMSPSSSEGGTNLNIHERALIVGESGHVYGTLGEKRPDGTVRAEQLQIKPLKSEVEKDKKLEEGNKAVVETQKKTLASFAGGGTATSTPDDFMQQLSTYLGSLGGAGGGTGSYSTPLPSLRLLAGAPANALAEDPVAKAYTDAGYSALGIDPLTVDATIKRFTPRSAQLVGQTAPRINFL